MQPTARIRQATASDITELARLRWQSTLEDGDVPEQWDSFASRFRSFAQTALASGAWMLWVLADDERLLGTVYIQEIAKVPRPNDAPEAYGYVTAVYLEPAVHNQGQGSLLLQAAIDAARARGLQFLLVWPSDRSVAFYERLGFIPSPEAMELELKLPGNGESPE